MDSLQPLGGGQAPAPPPPGAPAPPPHVPPPPSFHPPTAHVRIKRRSRIPDYLIPLLLLGGIWASAWYYQVLDLVNPNSPRAAAKAFVRAAYDGDIDKLIELCTTETQQLLAPLKQAASLGQTRPRAGQPKGLSWRATAVEVTDDRAKVTIHQNFRREQSTTSFTFQLPLLKEEGLWRVDPTGGLQAGREALKGLSGLFGGR